LSKVPSHLKTKGQLLDMGLKPNGDKVASILTSVYFPNRYQYNEQKEYGLYDVNNTITATTTDLELSIQSICNALYIINKKTKNIPGVTNSLIRERDRLYAKKHEIIPFLHSEERLSLSGYQKRNGQKKMRKSPLTKGIMLIILSIR
jgi:hypothetical protein